MKKKILWALGAVLLSSAMHAQASLYTTSFGSLLSGYGQNDDNTYGPQSLGFSLNFFGDTYSTFYISNNGLISFGKPIDSWKPDALNKQQEGKIIAPYWTDLDTRSNPDPDAGVYLSQTASQTVITWNKMGYFPYNYSDAATFQLVLNDTGNIGFYYGDMSGDSDYHHASAGFGDGLVDINAGELSLADGTSADVSRQLNGGQYFFKLVSGTPSVDPHTVPEPGTIALAGLGLLGFAASRRRKG